MASRIAQQLLAGERAAGLGVRWLLPQDGERLTPD